MVGDSNDETNLLHKLLLTNTQVSKIHKAFANNSSANIKLSKTQLQKLGQSGGFLGRLSRPLYKSSLLLMKNVLKPLAKSILIWLELKAAALATDAAIKYKFFGLNTTTWLLSNKDIIKELSPLRTLVYW